MVEKHTAEKRLDSKVLIGRNDELCSMLSSIRNLVRYDIKEKHGQGLNIKEDAEFGEWVSGDALGVALDTLENYLSGGTWSSRTPKD